MDAYENRRLGIEENLLRPGASHESAVSWTMAWIREAKRRHLEVDADYWPAGWKWIRKQMAADRKPSDVP
jgi:hypothetical protein